MLKEELIKVSVVESVLVNSCDAVGEFCQRTQEICQKIIQNVVALLRHDF